MSEAHLGDVFVQHVQAEVAGLRQEETRLRAEEEAIRTRAADIRKRINELLLALDVYRREMGVPAPVVEAPEDEPGERWADLAYRVMMGRGGAMKVANLVEELTERQTRGEASDRAEPTYATVYSSLKRDARFHPVAAGEFEIRSPNDDEVLQVVAASQLEHDFAGLKFLADRHGWHAKLAQLIERGLLVRYPVPNRNNPDFPTSAVRVAIDNVEVKSLLAPELLRRLESRAPQAVALEVADN